MKKILIVVIGLIVVVFMALILVPKLVDWNTRIAAIVTESTGRELRIDGDVQLSILPGLTFVMRDVHFANAPGMKAPQMVSVGSVSGKVRLFPLLARRVVVDELIIQKPSINLEVDSEGRANWVLAPAAEAPAEPEDKDADGKAALPFKGLSLGDVRLSQGRFSLRDATSGQKVVAKDVNLTIALAQLDSPLTLALQMDLNDESVKVDLAVDSPQRVLDGMVSTLQAAVVSKYVTTDYSGRMQQIPVPGLDGIFNLNVPSVGQLATWLGRPLDRAQPDPGPLVVRAVFEGAEKIVALKEATIAGKALKAKASGSFDGSGEIAKLTLTVESDTLDIDRYLPPPSAAPQKTQPRRTKPVGPKGDIKALFSNEPLDLSVLRRAEADVRIAIRGIKAMGYEIGQIGFTTSLKNGLLMASLDKLSLYGGSINGAVKLDASGKSLAVETNLNINRVKVDKLARVVSDAQAPVTGTASGNVQATAQGDSPRALVETLKGNMALQLGGVDVKNAPLGTISELNAYLDLPGIERSPSFKANAVYNRQRVTIDLTTDPLRNVLSDDVFALQMAVNSKLVTLGYKGKVQPRPVPGLDGAFDLRVPSVGKLAAWVGKPLDKSQPDPGPLKVQAVFKGDGAKVALKRATLEGKAIKAKASGSYDGSGEIARIALKVDSNMLDIDRYLPKATAKQPVPEVKGKAPSGAGNPLSGLSDAPFALEGLQKKAADVQIAIAGVKAMGYKIDRIALTSRLKDGVLTADLREVKLYSGKLKGNFKLDASGKRVGVMSAIDFKGIKVGEVAKTTVPNDLAVKGLASGRVKIDGNGRSPKALVESLGAKVALELAKADIRLPQAGSVSELRMDLDIPGLSKQATLKGGVVYNKEKVDLDLKLNSVQLALNRKPFTVASKVASKVFNASYNGTLQQQPNPGLDGALNLDVPSVSRLMSWMDQPLAKGQPDPGPVKLRAVFEAKGSRAVLKEANISGKALQAKASGQLDRRADKSILNAKLHVENANLNAYLPPPPEKQPVAEGKAPPAGKQKPGTWSDEPLDLSALSSADGDIDIKIGSLRYRELTIKPGHIAVKLKKGVLDVSIDPLRVADGTITSKLHLDAAKKAAKLNYQLDISGLEARPLLKTFAGNDRLSGNTEFTFKGSAIGRSQKALVRSLNGKGQFKFLDGAIHGINIPATLRQAKTLGLKKEAGEAVKTDFAELSGTFVIKKGILKNRDLKMLAPLMRLNGEGRVPMPPRTIDYDLTAKLVGSLKGQSGKDSMAGLPIPIKVSGPWHDIAYKVDWKKAFGDASMDPDRLRSLPQSLKESGKGLGGLPLPTPSGAESGGDTPVKQVDELKKQLLPGMTDTKEPTPTDTKKSRRKKRRKKKTESTTTQSTEEKQPQVSDPLKSIDGMLKR